MALRGVPAQVKLTGDVCIHHHHISISGLHITMIAGLFAALWMALWRRSFGLARWLRTPLPLRMPTPRAGAIAAMLAALGYCLLAGMGVPAQRTLLMLSTVAIARLTDRNVPASLSPCWAAAVVAAAEAGDRRVPVGFLPARRDDARLLHLPRTQPERAAGP